MEKPDEQNRPFPEGFEHVQERLNETTEHLKQIDGQIKNIPKEQGPTLKYNPPHFVGRAIPGSRDKTRIALEEKQHEIKMDVLSKTEPATRGADGQAGRVVRDRVRETLFPNPYRTLSQEDKQDQKSVLKEIEQSQDYMDAMLSPKVDKPKEEPRQTQDAPEKKDMANMSMSARFSMSLNYTKATERSEPRPAPSRDRQADKDRD